MSAELCCSSVVVELVISRLISRDGVRETRQMKFPSSSLILPT